MLSLDSSGWSQLEHAYGPASDVPKLLVELERDPGPKKDYRAEPWFTLWSSLCHQEDVYSASYAAAPHIVRICLAADGPIDLSFFLLPACIEIARATARGPSVPQELQHAYRHALEQIHECAFKHASHAWDDAMARSVAAALSAAKGRIKVAQAIVNLNDRIMDRIIAEEL